MRSRFETTYTNHILTTVGHAAPIVLHSRLCILHLYIGQRLWGPFTWGGGMSKLEGMEWEEARGMEWEEASAHHLL